jgi:hypothetical protein
MVYFSKRLNEPIQLDIERKKLGNYRHSDIISAIKSDFFDKCYICEQKGIASINIEHFAPHEHKDMIRKYNWNNLFWSCSHCNAIKSSKYNGKLINCTIKEDGVDSYIRYKLEPFATKKEDSILIEKIGNSIELKNTVDLLKNVYRGTTDLNKHQAALIRNNIYDEVLNFICVVDKYFFTEDLEKQDLYLYTIKNDLSNKSPFTAFKRDIIKNNNKYSSLEIYILP